VRTPFPFSAVVGSEEAKLALALTAVDPAIGGVLLRGEKGSAKSTLARGFARLLAAGAPFVELPLGATEERVVGSLDLAAALRDNTVAFQPGLLAAADGGLLYVDEVNLLADHLVDVLLDVAVSGRNIVERDNVSHEHPARFVLVGSMNPEEGDLRPQLLDRFGLSVDVRAPQDVAERAEVVRRRIAFDRDPAGFAAAWEDAEGAQVDRLAAARPAATGDEVLAAASRIAVEARAEGMRADLVLVRAAAARAGWEGRLQTSLDDLRVVAPLVLAHRARRHPLDPPGPPPQLDATLDEVLGPGPTDAGDDGGGPGEAEPDRAVEPAEAPSAVTLLAAPRHDQPAAGGRRSPVVGDRGRSVGYRARTGPVSSVAIPATLAAGATRRAREPSGSPGITTADLREPVREAKTGNLLVLAVDASRSMGADARMAAVKGALCGLLVDAYQRRDRVALVTFAGEGAEVALRPTGSVEVARSRLEDLPTGGATPLAAGLRAAADLARRHTTPTLRPLLVLVTDGRATAGEEPLAEAAAAAADIAHDRLPAVVIDVEPAGADALGLAAELARTMRARHLRLPDLTSGRLEAALRSLTR